MNIMQCSLSSDFHVSTDQENTLRACGFPWSSLCSVEILAYMSKSSFMSADPHLSIDATALARYEREVVSTP